MLDVLRPQPAGSGQHRAVRGTIPTRSATVVVHSNRSRLSATGWSSFASGQGWPGGHRCRGAVASPFQGPSTASMIWSRLICVVAG